MPEHEDELKRLANALGALVPKPARLDRDQVLFEAGRASVRSHRPWQFATAGLACVAGFLAVVLLLQPGPQALVQAPTPMPLPRVIVPAELVAPAPPDVQPETVEETPLPSHSYWHIHQAALKQGVEHMFAPPDSMTPASAPAEPIPSVGARNLPMTVLITGDY